MKYINLFSPFISMNEILNPLKDYKNFMVGKKPWVRILCYVLKIHVPIVLGAFGFSAMSCSQTKTNTVVIPTNAAVKCADVPVLPTSAMPLDEAVSPKTDTSCVLVIYPD